jgi:RHS repeat-associated protein
MVFGDDPRTKKREAELEALLAQGPPARGERSAPITWLFEPESFAPMAKLCGEQQHPILTDHLGTPVLMADANGTVLWRAEISAYGELRDQEGERHACPFRWPGQYEDAETGLYYNRFRYYDPEAGQYASQDPIGVWGGLRLYAYVGDPLGRVDPWGLTEGYVFRGIAADHPGLADAKQGIVAAPAPQSAVSAASHNAGGVSGSSRYTSWTHSPDVALSHATKSGPGGVVLAVPVGGPPPGATWKWEYSDDAFMEQEVLLEGRREGAQVMTPEEFSRRFGKECGGG